MSVSRPIAFWIGLALTIAVVSGCASMGGSSTPYENFTNVYLQENIHYEARVDRGGKTTNSASYSRNNFATYTSKNSTIQCTF